MDRALEQRRKEKTSHFVLVLTAYIIDWLKDSCNSSSINLSCPILHQPGKKPQCVQGNSHVHHYFIRRAILVVIRQVTYGAHRQHCLPNRIDNGQVQNGPVAKKEDIFS